MGVENFPQSGIDAVAAILEFVLAHGLQQLQHFGRADAMLLAEFLKELLVVGWQAHDFSACVNKYAGLVCGAGDFGTIVDGLETGSL